MKQSKLNTSLNPPCKNTVDFICRLIVDYRKNKYKEGDKFKLLNKEKLELNRNIMVQGYLEEVVAMVNGSLNKLYRSANQEDFYFFDCSFDLYMKIYSKRLSHFLIKHKNSIELDFLENEFDILNNPIKNRILNSNDYRIDYSKYLLKNVDFKIALKRKIEFVNRRIVEVKNQKKFNSIIFRSVKFQNWFFNILLDIGAIDESKKVSIAFQAKCSAVFKNKNCKDHIFTYGLGITSFIEYLNNEFQACIKSKNSLSSGINHEVEVNNLIQRILKDTKRVDAK